MKSFVVSFGFFGVFVFFKLLRIFLGCFLLMIRILGVLWNEILVIEMI